MTVRRLLKPMLALTALAALGGAAAAAELPVVRIGTVLDGLSELGDLGTITACKGEILTLAEGEFDVRFEPEHQLWGDWTLAGVEAAVDVLLADPEVDVVLALGALASHLFCCRRDLPKPVIAAVVLDAELQGLPRTAAGSSGVPNLNYLAKPDTFARDLDLFLEIVPFRKVAIFANAQLVAAIPGLEARVRGVFEERGLEEVYVPVYRTAGDVLAGLPAGVDAAYLTPLFQLPEAEWERLVAGLNERRIPTFSFFGEAEVRRGVLAGLGDETFFPRLVRRVALNVQRILLGEEAGELPVDFPVREQLTINMATARQVGVFPSWELLVEAVLLNRHDETIERRVSLYSAVEEAVSRNLDLLARSRRVEAGAENPRLARSALRPRIDLSALGVEIDEERAGSLLVPQAQRTLSGSLALEQVLWVEPLAANVAVQEQLQQALEADYEGLRLDVAQAAATAYLDVLRARTLEEVQRQNLQLTRSNLDLARVRREVGTAGEGEVVRWESQIAADRRAVVDARVAVEQAELALNRLLRRPLEEPFLTTEVNLQDPRLIMSEARLSVYTGDPRRYELTRDFLVADGLARSPELAELDRLIAARERQLLSDRRAYFSPRVGLAAEISDRLAEGGAGADAPDLGALLPPGLELEVPEEPAWSVGIEATLPLFAGGERAAAVAQGEAELLELRLARNSLAEQIEQRIRSALFAANGSFQGIGLSAAAAAAARRNLELVSDAYARGVLSILDLLDAQNAALVADQLAANAVYDFLIDLMEVQRAVNRFDFFISQAEREAWLAELEGFLRASGISVEEE